MAMERNPISYLMELSQEKGKKAIFNVLYSTGPSHQPRFLCQWNFDGHLLPAVFAPSKKEGKTLSARIALESMNYLPAEPREMVTFQTGTLPATVVVKSSTENLDPQMFSTFVPLMSQQLHNHMDVPVTSALRPHPFQCSPPNNYAINLQSSANLQSSVHLQSAALNSCHQPPGMPLRLGLNGSPAAPPRRVMQAFDSETLAALESRPKPPQVQQQQPVLEKQIFRIKSELPSTTFNDNTFKINPDNIVSTNSLGKSNALAQSSRIDSVGAPMDSDTSPGDYSINIVRNAVSVLHEMGQQMGVRPEFEVIGQSGPPHLPTFECRCTFGQESATVYAACKSKGKLQSFELILAKFEEMNLGERANLTEGESAGPSALKSAQNPISAVMELGNKLSVTPEFRCEQISGPLNPRFSGFCSFGDKRFGPIEGKNKKEAKTAVFQHTLDMLNADPAIKSELVRRQYRINSANIAVAGPSVSSETAALSDEDIQNMLSQKHPISAFLEYGQGRRMKPEIVEVEVDGPPHCRNFTYKCMLDGKSYPKASARSVKDAKKHAAELALRSLSNSSAQSSLQGVNNWPSPLSLTPSTSAAASTSASSSTPASQSDAIAQCVLAQFNTLKAQCGADLGKVILAGFVVENVTSGKFCVISVGTGNKCISGQNLSTDGTTVNDCHAEVIARRGLLRFFYQHLLRYKSRSSSMFEPVGDSGKAKLKSNLNLHLYISTAPCGDGAIFSHNESSTDFSDYSLDDEHLPTIEVKSQGQLRTKMEKGEGTIPTPTDPAEAVQTFDGVGRGSRLKTMSCSDKICKWNVLGVQGTLLSEHMEPVYISSLVLGQLFHPGHLSRALCCRVHSFNEFLSEHQTPFKLNHIKIDRTASELPRSTTKSKPLSLNWTKGDEQCELLHADSGQVIQINDQSQSPNGGSASRLSRKCLYKQYIELSNADAGDAAAGDSSGVQYYHDAKAAVSEYGRVKESFYKEFTKLEYGCWVRKPQEQNMFK